MGIGPETSITSTILVYFGLTSALSLWKRFHHNQEQESQADEVGTQHGKLSDDDDDDDTEDNNIDRRTRPCRFKRTLLALVVMVVMVIVVTIAEAAVRGIQHGGLKKDADDDILALLLFAFSWTILLLSLAGSQCVTFVHQGTSLLSLLLSASFILAKSLFYQPTESESKAPRDSGNIAATVLHISRVFLVALTSIFVCMSTWLPPPSVDDADPEREPLLAGAAAEDEVGTQHKNKNDDTSSDDHDDNDDDDDDDDKQDKAVNEFRNRPLLEYLKSFRVFLPFMWPVTWVQKAQVAGMVLCSIMQRVTTILQPLALGMVVNKMAESRSVPWQSILIFLCVGLINSPIGLNLLQSTLEMYLQGDQELALKRAAYDHILNLSADFHDSKTSSYVWSAMYQASSTVGLMLDVAFSIIPSIIDLIAGFAVLFTLFGDYMGLLVLATIVIFLWLTAHAISPRADLYRKSSDHWYAEHLQASDSTQNWYTVSEFNQIAYEKKQFRTLGQRVRDSNITIWWYNERSSAARYSLMTVAFAAACCLAAVQIARHEQKVGAFVTLTSYWAQLTAPLSELVREINSASQELVRAEKLLIMFERKPKVSDDADDTAKETFIFRGGEVEFDNVSFSYDGEGGTKTRQAADGISFRAPAGSTTAIVGETGGGKSTLLKLLFRFYDPQQGRVLIDAQDLRTVKLESFRKHIGWVPQEAMPFNKSILDNVRYSDPDLDAEVVKQACRDAALHDKIMTFGKRYHEVVGERGIKLSGGERQRLAIARAIVKAPDILLLDEATSAVDSITEAKIQASLERVGKSKTTFVIAHRLSTILRADQILVVGKGRLIERGSHDELIKLGGAYKKLWDSQLKLQQVTPAIRPPPTTDQQSGCYISS